MKLLNEKYNYISVLDAFIYMYVLCVCIDMTNFSSNLGTSPLGKRVTPKEIHIGISF